MTLSISPASTILAFSNDNEIVFFGANADKVATICRLQFETNSRGIHYLNIRRSQQDIVYPKLVAAGYKVAVIDS